MKNSLSDQQFIQYYRQILLPEVAEQGQQDLLSEHIIIVGIGGLGTHVAQQLAAAGIGHLYLIDDDIVEISNLPRQILFSPCSVGHQKVVCAKNEITRFNPDIHVSIYHEKFSQQFAHNILNNNPSLKQASENGKLMLLDCSDNMATRQLLNLWCVNHCIPLVSASVAAFSGQMMLVDGQKMSEAGCYHCVFSSKEVQLGCSDMGVLGPTVAVIASMQALTTVRHALNLNEPAKHLYIFDALTLSWRKITRHRDPNCKVCQHWPVLPSEKPSCQSQSVKQEAY